MVEEHAYLNLKHAQEIQKEFDMSVEKVQAQGDSFLANAKEAVT